MNFNSIGFFYFVCVVFSLYYLPFLKKFQISLLVLSSLFFYGFDDPALLPLLIASACMNALLTYFIICRTGGRSKPWLVLGILLNLLTLVFFKYSPFISKYFVKEGSNAALFLLAVPLPIGISFYTFEGISLLVDKYRETNDSSEHHRPRNFFLKTLFFISFFPHLIAGPILKARDIFPQIATKHLSEIDWTRVIKQLILGYFLKMVIADNLKDFTDAIHFPYFLSASRLTLIMMIFGYSMQIFADFAGYSMIAIGLGSLFGYRFPVNFNFPYMASSFQDFWKRWHISLSSFLMTYLYIPLGGNRSGKVRTYINLLITMVLGGLWHGAALSFAVWGLYHGLCLVVERALGLQHRKQNAVINVMYGMFVFTAVSFGWLLFKLPDFDAVIWYIKSIHNNSNLQDDTRRISFIAIYSLPVVLYHLFHLSRFTSVVRTYQNAFYGLLLFLLLINSGSQDSFIYFQF